jgi:hypothetical protein
VKELASEAKGIFSMFTAFLSKSQHGTATHLEEAAVYPVLRKGVLEAYTRTI